MRVAGFVLLGLLSLLTVPTQAWAASPQFDSCDASQQKTLTDATSAALAGVTTALALMDDGKADAYLTAWFGSPAAAPTVRDVLSKVQARLKSDTPLTFICRQSGCDHNLVGFAEKDRLSICPDYFNALPISSFNNQMGSLVHELTHTQADTKDHAYGTAGARRLAHEKPEQALVNADSYEFFVEAIAGQLRYGDRAFSEADSCRYAFNNVCDVSGTPDKLRCQPNTDTTDCDEASRLMQEYLSILPKTTDNWFGVENPDDSCIDANNGQCDEPGRQGSDRCRVGTDITDCRTPVYQPRRTN